MAPKKETVDSLLEELAYSPTTEKGQGFLPPFLRGLGHLYTLVSLLNEDDTTKHPSVEDIKREVGEAQAHFALATIDGTFSSGATEYMEKSAKVLTLYTKEVSDYTVEQSADKLRNVLNRFVAISSFLDREVLGIRNSDAGYSL